MNRTLEAIARALFKSWFIDFDPVRAKLDGRQPAGMDAETAALFPAEFEDGGAIGKIPKGWKVQKFREISEDVGLYLAEGSNYDKIIAFVWDDSRRTQDHEILINDLKRLPGVADCNCNSSSRQLGNRTNN